MCPTQQWLIHLRKIRFLPHGVSTILNLVHCIAKWFCPGFSLHNCSYKRLSMMLQRRTPRTCSRLFAGFLENWRRGLLKVKSSISERTSLSTSLFSLRLLFFRHIGNKVNLFWHFCSWFSSEKAWIIHQLSCYDGALLVFLSDPVEALERFWVSEQHAGDFYQVLLASGVLTGRVTY